MKTENQHFIVVFAACLFLVLCMNSCRYSKRSSCDAYGYDFSSSGSAYSSGNSQIQLRGANSPQKLNAQTVASAPFGSDDDGRIQNRRLYSNGWETDANDPLTLAKKEVPDVATEYERYNSFAENKWVESNKEAKSTFGIDVDNASYTNFRRFATNGQLPPKDAIRMEEWLNFFNYELEAPEHNDIHPVKITSESGPCPWNEEDELVMIKLQGKKPLEKDLAPSNLVFLVDVSGSMNSQNKLPLVQSSMITLTEKLRPQDKMSIVTYAGASDVALEPTSGNEKNKIINAINGLTSGGSTAGAQGINTAYELAKKNFLPDGNNRIILATDGDWNVGITDKNELKKMIEEKRKSGIFLSVLGFGMGNLNDEMMESIADNGNGNYAYIDSEKESERIFNSEFSGSMYVIAKDVKLQLEFDSSVVEKYRLIGYENRVLENWQFEADSIDAGDLGMGQNVIAFYQVTRKKGQRGNLGKIDFRYKPLKSDVSTLVNEVIEAPRETLSSDYKYASCVVEFALCLRESEHRGNAKMAEAILRGKQNLGDQGNKLSYEKRVEFVGLMEKTAEMWEGYVIEKAPEITEDKFPQLKLYPNPAKETTTIVVPKELSTDWSIQIFTLAGELVKVEHFHDLTEGKIDLTGISPQVYLVKVYGKGQNYGYLRLVVG